MKFHAVGRVLRIAGLLDSIGYSVFCFAEDDWLEEVGHVC